MLTASLTRRKSLVLRTRSRASTKMAMANSKAKKSVLHVLKAAVPAAQVDRAAAKAAVRDKAGPAAVANVVVAGAVDRAEPAVLVASANLSGRQKHLTQD
jgi:hypothetical protein